MARTPHAEAAGGARTALRLALGLVVAAAAFDAAPLYVPAVALLVLAGGLGAWVRLAGRGVAVHASGPRSAVEDEPYPLKLELRRGLLPWPQARVVHPQMSGGLRLPRHIAGAVTAHLRFPRRGRWTLEPARLQVSDPLGMHRAEVEGRARGAVLVLPRVEPVRVATSAGALPAELAGLHERGEGGGGLDTASTDFEIDGLRPYRRGSPASRIHWPTAARRAELMEHRLVSGASSAPIVVLDGAGAGEDALDRAVRAAASLCRHLARTEGCVLVAPGAPRPLRIDRRLRGFREAHALLALAGPLRPPSASRLAEAAGALFWVSASGHPPGRLLRRGSVFLITPEPAEGEGVAFTVAGCSGRRLSTRAHKHAARAA
jgi:uncharacterized protein (DUF58 family)